MNKINFKQWWPHLVAIALFLLLTIFYFSPVVFDGKDLPQGDVTSAKAWGKDAQDFHKKTGEYAYWSNAMFSGMPANYTYAPPTKNIFAKIGKIITLNMPTIHIGLFFLYLLGFYIFLISIGCKPWLSIVGSIAYAFASYNFIIIEAGHINKGLVMATMAPILGGIILCYRKKYLWGVLVTLLFAGLNILWSHQQISYYLLLIIGLMVVVYLIYAIKEHTLKDFFKSSVILIGVAILAVLPASGKLITTMDYTKDTMRGGAVLQSNAEGVKESSGLDIDYAYQWSYGKMETMTLLIPNFYGASSGYKLGDNSECHQVLKGTGQGRQFCRQAPTYWGPQPFTSGPVYAGAIICFLFILGLMVVKGPEKWWLLAATILSIFLSWGKNFSVFNDFLFYHLPLYSKFRTPSMALVIAGVTMVTLAVLAIKEMVHQREDKEKNNKNIRYLYIAGGITGGLCLIFALFGGTMFSFEAASDANFPEWLVTALQTDRKSMLTSDAWRSLVFILLSGSLLLIFLKKQFKPQYLLLGLGVLILIDMWSVDRRYLNSDNFVSKKKAKAIVPTQADEMILQDKDPNYRVLNLASNTFNESSTSYFHKSVGGYSPAKLRRYQDIIDYHFSKKINTQVVNMLNTRYIIVPTEQGPMVQKNPEALGNAWFVDSLRWVNSPDEEIVSLYNFNASKTAVIDKEWKEKLYAGVPAVTASDSNAYIKLSEYNNPGYLIYESSNSQKQLAVFSEVFYKTWKAYIDGKEVPVIRVNYILRGLEIPSGQHKIEFKCIDELYENSAQYSLWGSILVGIILAGLIGLLLYREFSPRYRKEAIPSPIQGTEETKKPGGKK